MRLTPINESMIERTTTPFDITERYLDLSAFSRQQMRKNRIFFHVKFKVYFSYIMALPW